MTDVIQTCLRLTRPQVGVSRRAYNTAYVSIFKRSLPHEYAVFILPISTQNLVAHINEEVIGYTQSVLLYWTDDMRAST